MLRAISEMAVAISVWSVLEKPSAIASSRPFCRAVTTSRWASTRTLGSEDTLTVLALPYYQVCLEIGRRGDALPVIIRSLVLLRISGPTPLLASERYRVLESPTSSEVPVAFRAGGSLLGRIEPRWHETC
jgi:hypothetical protein